MNDSVGKIPQVAFGLEGFFLLSKSFNGEGGIILEKRSVRPKSFHRKTRIGSISNSDRRNDPHS